jgi:hypothetical protein
MPRQTFGARFLEGFRRLGGSTKGWPDWAVERFAVADRRQFIALLETRHSPVSSELLIAAHTAEPETLAKRAFAKAVQDDAMAGGDGFLPIG